VDNNPTTYEIVIEDSGLVIPEAGTSDGGGFDIDVDDWPEQPVPVPL
jgi:hypothetical protein